MDTNKLKDYLNNMASSKSGDYILKYANSAAVNKDFSDQTITHTILDNSVMTNSNFNRAAVTGSIFTNCQFENCSMDQSDFEFCEFNNCQFQSGQKIISSFNNSTFINSRFTSLTFLSATFTDAYFEGCEFDNVSIAYTTLENALFRRCKFRNMDLRNLNMDYIEFDNLEMENVVLPMTQIPYMFGCLKYLGETENDVTISCFDEKDITIKEYLEETIPELITYFGEEKEYFPLANIFLFQKKAEQAIQALKNGLIEAVSKKDFRMIKFYCKLISYSDLFPARTLHEFYNQICRLLPVQGGSEAEAQNYIRNIGDIKYILFDRTKRPSLHITFLTNLRSQDADKVALVLGRLFFIAKMGNLNNVSLTLTENSPLLIDAQINGEENNLSLLLPLLLMLAGVSADNMQEYPLFYLPTENDLQKYQDEISAFQKYCIANDLRLQVVNYYVENFNENPDNKFRLYYNSTIRKERFLL